LRVFVTGVGMVSPLGVGVEHNWTRLLNGETNIHSIPSQWQNYVDFNSQHYCPLPEIVYADFGYSRREILQQDQVALLGTLATGEALENAGIEVVLENKKKNQFRLKNVDPQNCAVVYGTGYGGGNSYISNVSHQILKRHSVKLQNLEISAEEKKGLIEALRFAPSYNPFTVTRVISNSVGSSIGIKYSISGPNRTIVQACSSGTTAIGLGYELIAKGKTDLVIVGGSENVDDEYGCGFYSFDAAGALVKSDDSSDIKKLNRPFDQNRNGFMFAQGGSGTLILESARHAEKRNAEPLAEVVGFAETFDAHSIMAPEPSGKYMQEMIKATIKNAALTPANIDYVNAHGTSTIANDEIEANTIEHVFGRKVAINSTKSIIGHTTGASGAIEAVVTVLSIRDQELHPSLNIESPIADLDFVTTRRAQKVEYALSQSFAFGGHNSGLILAKV